MKVYIEEGEWLPTEVLKHSARRHTKSQIEFCELKPKLKKYPGFSRFSIPEASHFEGRVLYVDANCVVLGDLQELFNRDMQGKGVLSRPNPPLSYYTSVMLMDCAKLTHWKIDDWETMVNGKIASYSGTLWGDPTGLSYRDFGPLEEFWNHFDQWDETTKILHYVPNQPWKAPGHPLAHIFLSELRQAIEDKVLTKADVEKQIAAGHVYSGILNSMF